MRMYLALMVLCFTANIVAMEKPETREFPDLVAFRESINALAELTPYDALNEPTLDGALKKIEALKTAKFAFLLDDLENTRVLVSGLYRKFGLDLKVSPTDIAQRLKTEGAKKWLARRPEEIKLNNLLIAGEISGVDVVHMITQGDVYVDARSGDLTYRTVFMVAMDLDYFDLAQFLLNSGADINAQDVSGYTSLMRRVYEKGGSVLEFLLARGADPKIKNKQGETALDIARRYNLPNIVALLEKAENK